MITNIEAQIAKPTPKHSHFDCGNSWAASALT